MQRYEQGRLIDSIPLTPEQNTSLILQDRLHEWESEKKLKEAELKAEIESKLSAVKKEIEKMKLDAEKDCENQHQLLAKEKEEFQEIKTAFEEEKKAMAKFQEHHASWIKLNIGGTMYQTSKSTLLKFKSWFSVLLSGNYKIDKDETGAILIDRNGQHFGIILDFLRDGSLPSTLSPSVVEALLKEADFYQLEELSKLLMIK